MTSPAFTDSPEDLIARAKEVVRTGRMRMPQGTPGETPPGHLSYDVPPAVCVFIGDVTRALEAERQSRASSFAGYRAQNLTIAELERGAKKAAQAVRLSKLLAAVVVALLLVDVILVVHR